MMRLYSYSLCVWSAASRCSKKRQLSYFCSGIVGGGVMIETPLPPKSQSRCSGINLHQQADLCAAKHICPPVCESALLCRLAYVAADLARMHLPTFIQHFDLGNRLPPERSTSISKHVQLTEHESLNTRQLLLQYCTILPRSPTKQDSYNAGDGLQPT